MQPYPIKLNWKAETDNGDMVVFPKFHQVPFSKILTFYRRDNFKIEAEYDGDVPVMNPLIGQFEIGDVKPLVDGGNQKVKVKVRINLHGVFVTSSANYTEKHEVSQFLIVIVYIFSRNFRQILSLLNLTNFFQLLGQVSNVKKCQKIFREVEDRPLFTIFDQLSTLVCIFTKTPTC